jgi:transposase
MPDLLDRVRQDITQRLAETRAVVQEHNRLEAALAALDTVTETGGQTAAQPKPTRGKPRRKRAPHGANREAVLRVVEERPGVSPAEIASASGVRQNVVYVELRRLVEAGELTKQQMPGGRVGYSCSSAASTSPTKADGETAASTAA